MSLSSASESSPSESNAVEMSASSKAERPFDLVVLDLDGTILHLYHHAPVSDYVVSTIAAVQAAGIPVAIKPTVIKTTAEHKAVPPRH